MEVNLFPPLKRKTSAPTAICFFHPNGFNDEKEKSLMAHRMRNDSGNWTFDAELEITYMILE